MSPMGILPMSLQLLLSVLCERRRRKKEKKKKQNTGGTPVRLMAKMAMLR